MTSRLSLYLLHWATMDGALAEGSLLILLVAIGLELLLYNPLFSVSLDSLHIGHVQEGRYGLTFFECLRVHIICHLNLQLSLPFNFELCLVLEGDKVSLDSIKEG